MLQLAPHLIHFPDGRVVDYAAPRLEAGSTLGYYGKQWRITRVEYHADDDRWHVYVEEAGSEGPL